MEHGSIISRQNTNHTNRRCKTGDKKTLESERTDSQAEGVALKVSEAVNVPSEAVNVPTMCCK